MVVGCVICRALSVASSVHESRKIDKIPDTFTSLSNETARRLRA